MTVAPEIEGAMKFIKEISNECMVSVAHTGADYETACAAFGAGSNHVTHLYNAMTILNHRETGVLGDLLKITKMRSDIYIKACRRLGMV